MLALVTGGTGFIGSHLIRGLHARGVRVRALVRARGRAEDLERLGTELVEEDLLEPRDLRGAMAGVETIFHLAGQIQPTAEGAASHRANVGGTANLLRACRGLDLRAFIHVSSVAVMGTLPALPADEETPLAPDNDYGRSKAEGERLVRQAFLEDRLPAVVARPAWVYGPGDRRTLRLFAAIARRRFPLVGSGRTWLHPVYVDDLVEGLLRCGTEAKAVGETYLLAGPEPIRLRPFVTLTAELAGVPPPRVGIPVWLAWLGAAAAEGVFRGLRRRPPLYRRQLEFFLKDQWFSTTKARTELGFVPATALRAGLGRTIAWYRERGLLA